MDKLEKKRLFLFLALSFGLTYLMVLPVAAAKAPLSSATTVLVFTACMFIPALSSIIIRLITRESFKNIYLAPRIKGNVREYLMAWFLPTAFILLGGALYFVVFPSHFDPALEVLGLLLPPSSAGMNLRLLLLLQVIQGALIGPAINIIPTLGEELGWRGYLLVKLDKAFGPTKAILISSVIWGVWHAPMIALGHNYGTGYFLYPWSGILMMVLFCIALGGFFSYLTLKTKSVIPCAIAHSAANAMASLPVYMSKPGYFSLLGPTIAGLIAMIPLLIACVFFLRASKNLSFENEDATEDVTFART